MMQRHCFRVVVVEDELPILDNLVEKLAALDLPVQVVGTATDGEQGLELIKTLSPHILITDIRMPVLDGLAMLEQARKLHPTLRTVIISGYSDFEYAQKAIQQDVTAYLLKPISATELASTMGTLCDRIAEQMMTQERQIMMAQLTGSGGSAGLPSDFAGESFNMYLICLGGLYDRCYEQLDATAMEQLWAEFNLPSLLQAQDAPPVRWWLVGEKVPNCQILITIAQQRKPNQQLYSQLLERLANRLPATICGAYSPISFQDIWQVAQRLRELLYQRLVPGLSQFITLEQLDTPELYFAAQQQLLGELLLACRSRQPQQVSQRLRSFLTACQQGNLPQRQLELWLLRLLEDLEVTAIADIDSATLRQDIFAAISTAVRTEQLYPLLQRRLQTAVTDAYTSGGGTPELATAIRQYIDDHYLSMNGLEAMADLFHFSSSYITRIFKKQYGLPPLRYLLRLRIEEAKRLIEENDDLNIADVSQAVGYEDQHYFSRIFKSTTGMTPSEYKKSLI